MDFFPLKEEKGLCHQLMVHATVRDTPQITMLAMNLVPATTATLSVSTFTTSAKDAVHFLFSIHTRNVMHKLDLMGGKYCQKYLRISRNLEYPTTSHPHPHN